MPRLDDFEAWIEVEGARLDEYKVETDQAGKTVDCWIPSEAGKNFVVFCKDHSKLHTVECCIILDGHICRRPALTPTYSETWRNGSRTSPTTLRLFQFAHMLFTEDEWSELHNPAPNKSLGTIKLVLQTGSIGDVHPFRPDNPMPGPAPVYEKLKIPGPHRVQLGGEVISVVGRHREFISDRSQPWKLVFQYRPKDLLQAMDIMPRDNTTAAIDPNVKEEAEGGQHNGAQQGQAVDLAAVQVKIEELQTQIDALREITRTHSAVKLETRPDVRGHRMKVEEIQASRFFPKGEVIDLTEECPQASPGAYTQLDIGADRP
ncbi:hypothetical protein CALVIDRAFT_387426 [Calocera viscosa TUFC12733]|uniref:DUF7918 domain-containing protein n=1 Tax=Calocera viscosa (strain TUFC12733) TaxID=1330018 RepID=A0A167GLC9_CALVF|nr:hypothetical protein CALVIDRAFT_387426 [Calocera viscosa TUFC12733]